MLQLTEETLHGEVGHAEFAQAEAGGEVGSKEGGPEDCGFVRVQVAVQVASAESFRQDRLRRVMQGGGSVSEVWGVHEFPMRIIWSGIYSLSQVC